MADTLLLTADEMAAMCLRSFLEWVDGNSDDVTDEDRDQVRLFREALANITGQS